MKLDKLIKLSKLLTIPDQVKNTASPFILTDIQKDFLNLIHNNKRTILLKARQIYATTASLLYVMGWCLTNPGLTAAIYFDDHSKCLDKIKQIEAWLNQLGIDCIESNQRYLKLPNGAIIRAFSAVSRGPAGFSRAGRGTTANLLYFSELGFYPDAENTFTSAVSSATPNAKIIVESTSSGANTLFNKLYYAEGWASKFYGCQDHKAYVSDVPLQDKEWANYQDLGFTSKPHASWFHSKLKEEFGNDLKRFILEFPILEEHCWLSQSGRFIDKDTKVIPFTTNHIKDLHIYYKPTATSHYIVTFDPSQGVSLDHAAIAVLDLYTGKLMASWVSNKVDVDQQSQILSQIYNFYNIPLDRPKFSPELHVKCIVVESNGVGGGTIPFLRKGGLPIYEITTLGGTKDYSKYLNFLNVKRVVEDEKLEGDEHLLKEVKGLTRNEKGKFLGSDDLIAAIGFGLSYIERVKPHRSAPPKDPQKVFMVNKFGAKTTFSI